MKAALVLVAAAALASPTSPLSGQSGDAPDDEIRSARTLESAGKLDEALARYDALVERYADDWRGPMLRGQLRFRLGDNEPSLADFDRVVELAPAEEPYLWQRGIAQYYAGRDAACLLQFELHRTVNPNDVENAVWHFLCRARKDGVEAARDELLPVGPDARAPMGTIYELYRGDARPDEVLEAAERTGGDAARFYADLYVGLYLDAVGRSEEALPHIRAAAEAGVGGYMRDVARVHLGALLGRR